VANKRIGLQTEMWAFALPLSAYDPVGFCPMGFCPTLDAYIYDTIMKI